MPRNMSVAMTTPQVKAKTKDITRRFGWWFLKPGDIINLVEKSMGLQKGDKIVRICQVKVKSTRKEPLNAITQADVIREGFPEWTPRQFVDFLVAHYGCEPTKLCNRIEFEYLMEITTYFWKDAGPWISFTEGHVDKAEFLAIALADKDTREIIDGEEINISEIEAVHGYIKPLQPNTKEWEENGGEDDEVIWIDTADYEEDAIPVTSIVYEFTG